MVSFVPRAVFWGATLIRGRRLFWSESQWRGAYFKAALASGKMVSKCEFVWDNYIHTMQLIEKLKLGKRSEPYFQSCNASNMELFAKIVDGFILDIWRNSDYTSEGYLTTSLLNIILILFKRTQIWVSGTLLKTRENILFK